MTRQVIITLLSCLPFASSGVASSFKVLDSPYLSLSSSTYPLDFSDDGTVMIIWDSCYSYTWKSGVGNYGPGSSRALSASGTVVVGGSSEAYRWDNGSWTYLGFLPHHTGNSRSSDASSVSQDGSVVVGSGYDSTHGYEAFRWEAGTMQPLGFLPGAAGSEAIVVSGNSRVVGGDSGNQAFRWESGLMMPLGDLPGSATWSTVSALSYDGSAVVGHSQSTHGAEAFIWEDGLMTGLGDLPGGIFWSEAMDISLNGSCVVGKSTTDSGDTAFIWDRTHGMRDLKAFFQSNYGLDMTGWELEDALSVSADGTPTFGKETGPNGESHWIATVPEPATALLFGFGVAFL